MVMVVGHRELFFLLTAAATISLSAESEEEWQTKMVQFVDGHPVAPAHSMLDDIQSMLVQADDNDGGGEGRNDGIEQKMEKGGQVATCAQGVCQMMMRAKKQAVQRSRKPTSFGYNRPNPATRKPPRRTGSNRPVLAQRRPAPRKGTKQAPADSYEDDDYEDDDEDDEDY